MTSRRAPRLRPAVLVLTAIHAFLAFAASTALIGLTALLHHRTTLVGEADSRMRASLRTRSALLWFARESDLAVAQPSHEALDEQSRAEAELHAEVDETRRLATPDRAKPLDNLVRKTDDYVELRKRLQSEGLPLGVIMDRVKPALDGALADLRDLVTTDDAFARSQQASARSLGSVAVVVGLTTAVLLSIGLAAAVIVSRRLIERPILMLNHAIERFGKGEADVRAQPEGVFEVRQIATTFNEMADRTARLEKDRLTFLAGVAHDLRGPLTPLKLTMSRLHGNGAQPPSEGGTNVLALVERQVERLDRMIGDLLDVTRIQSGELALNREWIDLRSLVARVADLYRPVSEPCRITVVTPPSSVDVFCDPVRVEQVLINLLSNAIKYSPDGGSITLHVGAEEGGAVVRVSDEGVGVPPSERERIFEPFRRGEKTRELVGGVGLGLSASRKIARAHGGTLVAESAARGASFRLTLPPRDRSQATAPPGPGSSLYESSMR